MRHRVAGRHLGRDTGHRLALYRNLVTELFRHERITTTETKAKEIRPLAEKMITLAKRGDLHARRQARAFVYDPKVVRKLFTDIATRMKDRNGGYTRITKLERRLGDGAPMAAIELVDLLPPAERPRRRPARTQPAPTPRAAAPARPAGGPPADTPATVSPPSDLDTAADAPAEEDTKE